MRLYVAYSKMVSKEILVQCLLCCKKKAFGLSDARSKSHYPLCTEETTTLQESMCICNNDNCPMIRLQIQNFPHDHQTAVHAQVNEYIAAIDDFYKGILSRPEFVVKRILIKRNVNKLRKEAEIAKANLLLEAAGASPSKRVKRKREESVASNITHGNVQNVQNMQVPIQRIMQTMVQFMLQVRSVNADPGQAKDYWIRVLCFPPEEFDRRYLNDTVSYNDFMSAEHIQRWLT